VATPPPKLIPKGRLGISVWVEILLGIFFSYEPVERQLENWALLGLDLAPGTITGGLKRLEPLFTPVYEALLARGVQAGFAQADETPWLVFVEREGKVSHRWWRWLGSNASANSTTINVSGLRTIRATRVIKRPTPPCVRPSPRCGRKRNRNWPIRNSASHAARR
jgi:hypothetical protein